MAVVRLWVGAELRRRWRLHLALALLIGVVGAVILTVGAGARTTASARNWSSVMVSAAMGGRLRRE